MALQAQYDAAFRLLEEAVASDQEDGQAADAIIGRYEVRRVLVHTIYR